MNEEVKSRMVSLANVIADCEDSSRRQRLAMTLAEAAYGEGLYAAYREIEAASDRVFSKRRGIAKARVVV